MTKGNFNDALNKIDTNYITESLNYGEPGAEKRAKRFNILKFASVAAAFALVLSCVLAITLKKDPSPNVAGLGSEISIGQYGEETTGHNLGIKCRSFYEGRTITFDVFMSQPVDGELDGYPVFEVYQGFPEPHTEINVYKEDHAVVINGEKSRYEKRFTLEDLGFLSASYDSDVFDGHKETVTLDFSGFDIGEAVTVTLSYGFFYYKNNPFNQPQPDNSWCGRRWSLNFYIGEDGIAVSSNSTEDSLTEYERITGVRPDLWDYIHAIERAGESSSITHREK